ncbi:MAG: GAF domain-containing protein [Nitrospirae bacterium]|nr:GAF domain-containing protein [Nitrospirota bacterium]
MEQLDTRKLIDISIEEDQLLVTIIDLISIILNVSRISVMFYDEDKNELILKAAKGIKGIKIGSVKRIGDDVSGWVIRNKKPLFINDLKQDSRFKESDFKNQFTTASLISVPLVLEDRLIGVLNINNKQTGEGFTEADLNLLQSFTKQISIAISNILSYHEKLNLYKEVLNAKNFTQTIIDDMPDGLIAIDGNENIIAFNKIAERITLLRKEDVINNSYKRFRALDFINSLIENAKGISEQDNIKYINLKGEPFILRAKASQLKDYEQNIVGALILFTDVTSFKEIAEKLRQSRNLIFLGEAARNIGHEIGNKISGLDMFAELLTQELPVDDQRRPYANELKEGIGEMMGFLKKFKEVYKNISIYPAPIDINAIINKILNRNSAIIKKRDINVENKLDTIPAIEGDEIYLESALLNIILNAIEAMDNKGTLTVSTELKKTKAKGSVIEIGISDTGHGISPENLEKIFVPCYTTKKDGSGLGLTITQKIIEAHNGTMKVESIINKGTALTIQLPLKQYPSP